MANYAIFGTGSVGQALAARLVGLGHGVMIGTRSVADTLARTDKDMFGNPPFGEWLKNNSAVKVGTFAQAAAFGNVLVNATSGHGSIAALQSAGENNVNGKVLIDIANPLDFSKGFPPSLWVCNTDSLGEQIQKAFPAVKVVKTLNTMNAYVMVNPALIPGDHSVFLSGNDTDAKTTVKALLQSFGWTDKSMIDLGDITTARGTEMLLPAWVRLFGTLQTPMFNFNINIAK